MLTLVSVPRSNGIDDDFKEFHRTLARVRLLEAKVAELDRRQITQLVIDELQARLLRVRSNEPAPCHDGLDRPLSLST